jgi:hypothetical protein
MRKRTFSMETLMSEGRSLALGGRAKERRLSMVLVSRVT